MTQPTIEQELVAISQDIKEIREGAFVTSLRDQIAELRAALTAQAGDGWKPIEEVPEGWRLEQLAFYRNSENQPKWICDLYNEKANRLASTNCHDTAAEALRAAIAAAKDGK